MRTIAKDRKFLTARSARPHDVSLRTAQEFQDKQLRNARASSRGRRRRAEGGAVKESGKRHARNARQLGAEKFSSPLLGLYPLSHLPGRIMPNVLRVSALQLGDPVLLRILMISDDAPRHRWPVGDHSLHRST